MNKNKIPENVKKRIDLWYIIAIQSYQFMLADEYLWELFVQDIKKENVFSQKYIIDNTERHFNVLLSAIEGLHTAVVIMFWQIFDEKSYGGHGISSNAEDYLKNVRKELDNYLIKQLDWDENKYKKFKDKLKNIRHKLVAHYDGSFADYQEVLLENGKVSKMKPPGYYFNRDEAKEFLSVLKLTYEFILSKLKEVNQ
jgi:hypothetical protein